MNIHIVEDDLAYGKLLSHTLNQITGCQSRVFDNGHDYLAFLQRQEGTPNLPDVITIDWMLPDMNGSDLLKKLRTILPPVDVVIVSGQENIETAVDLLRMGAYDYIPKTPYTLEQLTLLIQKLKEKWSMQQQLKLYRNQPSGQTSPSTGLIGESAPMQAVFAMVQKATHFTNVPVTFQGETGTGKALLAKTIHYNSARKHQPFITLHLDAVSPEFHESELWGCEKDGTGNSFRKGAFEDAAEGTLYIDEIAALSPALQHKLLNMLQTKTYKHVGGKHNFSVHARLMVASSLALGKEVKAGRFLSELYFTLMGLPISIPPLRDRQNDILLLAQHFLELFALQNQIHKITISPKAKRKLLNYSYPGNIPELKSIIELAAILADNQSIQEEHIVILNPVAEQPASTWVEEELTLKAYNEKLILHYLNLYDHNVMKVAEVLDIGKSTIYNLLKKGS